jgi:Ni2+-binding GTPase involved in maturation of urease and hydrogenase
MQFERLLNDLDFLFIENVGNLVCPSSMKYTTIFNSADVAIVTKMDLAAAVEFDEHSAYSNVQAVRLACRYSSSPPKPTTEWINIYVFGRPALTSCARQQQSKQERRTR